MPALKPAIASLLLTAFPSVGWACSCIPPKTASTAEDSGYVMFRGVAFQTRWKDGQDANVFGSAELLTTIRVDQPYVGNPPALIEISHPQETGGNCGFFPALGKPEFFVVRPTEHGYETDGCTVYSYDEADIRYFLMTGNEIMSDDPEICDVKYSKLRYNRDQIREAVEDARCLSEFSWYWETNDWAMMNVHWLSLEAERANKMNSQSKVEKEIEVVDVEVAAEE